MTHIILIGFKNVGKTFIGKKLAAKMKMPFIDLDEQIEFFYRQKHGKRLSCRQIMELHGKIFFRKLENDVLKKTLKNPAAAIIAVGGGTPLKKENRILLQQHCIIHVAAPKKIVFQRIKNLGRPAFFPKNESLYDAFNRLWEERIPVFRKIADITINNK